MEMYALDEEVGALESVLAETKGAARLPQLVTLAWYLRECDTRRALSLADEAEQWLPASSPLFGAHEVCALRLGLIRATAKWLFAELGEAQAMAAAVLQQAQLHDAPIAAADACWLLAWIATDRGDSAGFSAQLEAAAHYARTGGDMLRADVADTANARMEVLHDLPLAEKRWGSRFAADQTSVHPVLDTWLSDFFGIIAFQSSDFGRATTCFMRTYECGMASGQVRRAITAATNIGNGFTSLNDHHAALEWMQRGLDRARQTDWPNAVGASLSQTAETLRHLGQLDAAQKLLQEALGIMAPIKASRSYAMGLTYLADVGLDRRTYALALETFRLLEERADGLNQADFKITAWRGQAHALSHLGRPLEAQQAALSALALAREQADACRAIDVLKVLAQIHSQHVLPAPEPVGARSPALHYLLQALEVAATIDGYTVPGDLFDAIAHEHAMAGDFELAYETALQASHAREKIYSKEATNRGVALQVRHQTERAKTEGEHHRQLAEAEARRAEVLQQTSITLSHLSAVGQEITAHLSAAAVFESLHRHVSGMLDAMVFQVYMLDDASQVLERAYGIEDGKPLPPGRIAVSNPKAISARCVRERRELLIDLPPETEMPILIPGTQLTRTMLFAPLMIGARILGVMSVQALPRHAYAERDLLIFRTLCAYGAIALDNARAYRQLEATLKTLTETEVALMEKNLELEEAYRTLEEVSLTDPLTGLRNRRFLFQHMENDIAISLRRYDDLARGEAGEAERAAGMDLVFFMVDLDHFKEINDHYGHAAGDQVLIEMRARLREVFRESDYLIRWGGEEFLVVARATRRHESRIVAERIRAVVAGRPFDLLEGQQLLTTCSVGYACFPFFADQPRLLNWGQVLQLADHGLYMAKHGGRNAWVGLSGGACRERPDPFQRIMQDAAQAVAEGEVILDSHFPDAKASI